MAAFPRRLPRRARIHRFRADPAHLGDRRRVSGAPDAGVLLQLSARRCAADHPARAGGRPGAARSSAGAGRGLEPHRTAHQRGDASAFHHAERVRPGVAAGGIPGVFGRRDRRRGEAAQSAPLRHRVVAARSDRLVAGRGRPARVGDRRRRDGGQTRSL